jgi:hypothetical protein
MQKAMQRKLKMAEFEPAKIAHFLVKNDLQFILQKSRQLLALNDSVKVYLEPNIQGYCQVANLVDNHLIMIAANGSIATQIRFTVPDLLSKFKHNPLLKNIKSIHCKVQPSLNQSYRPPKPAQQTVPLLSKESAAIIQEIAQEIKDERLKKSLLKLADNC